MWAWRLLWLLAVGGAGSETVGQEQELVTHLLEERGYRPQARPLLPGQPSLAVQILFALEYIVRFDESNQIVQSTGWMVFSWRDARLSWNISLYPCTSLQLPADKIWTPLLHVRNSVRGFQALGDTERERLSLNSSGQVTWVTGFSLETTCIMDISRYPFDSQDCPISFILDNPDSSGIVPVCSSCKVELTTFQNNSEWKLSNSSLELEVFPKGSMKAAKLEVRLTLSRQFKFIVLTVIIPIMCLSILIGFVFVLPSDSGEKMALAISIFLSYSVFLAGVSDTLPNSYTSFFTLYLATMISLSFFAAVMAAYIISVHHRSGPVSLPWRIAFCFCCRKRKTAPPFIALRMPEVDQAREEQSGVDGLTLFLLHYLKTQGVLIDKNGEEDEQRRVHLCGDEQRVFHLEGDEQRRFRLEGVEPKDGGPSARVHPVKAWLRKARSRKQQKKRGKPNVTWPEVAQRLNTLCMLLTFALSIGALTTFAGAIVDSS